MVSLLPATARGIDYNPRDVADLSAVQVKAQLQVAAIKTELDVMELQGRELARLMEPHKGQFVDARA